MHTSSLVDAVTRDAMSQFEAQRKTYTFEDVPLRCGWSATVSVDRNGTVVAYMACSPDGLKSIWPETTFGGVGFAEGCEVGAQVVEMFAGRDDIPAAHETHRAKRRGRARLLAAVETPISDADVNAMLRHLAEHSRADAAIAGQTQELIRRCVECDCTNNGSLDADFNDRQGDDDGN